MNLDDLRALLKVADHGSFQAAAAALRVSRSGLRRQIERLEVELDVLLVDRAARGITLTAAGQILTQGAADLLREADELADRTKASSGRARGVMRFVVPSGLPQAPRARALIQLRRIHPELDVEVVEAEDPLALVGEPFDLMIHYGDAPARSGWFSHVVLRVPLRLRATPAYLEAHGIPTSPEALAEHVVLAWNVPGKSGDQPFATPWLRSANLSLLLDLALADVGIVYGPVLPPPFGADDAGLVVLLESQIQASVTVRALSPRPSRSDPRVSAMLENLHSLLASGLPG